MKLLLLITLIGIEATSCNFLTFSFAHNRDTEDELENLDYPQQRQNGANERDPAVWELWDRQNDYSKIKDTESSDNFEDDKTNEGFEKPVQVRSVSVDEDGWSPQDVESSFRRKNRPPDAPADADFTVLADIINNPKACSSSYYGKHSKMKSWLWSGIFFLSFVLLTIIVMWICRKLGLKLHAGITWVDNHKKCPSTSPESGCDCPRPDKSPKKMYSSRKRGGQDCYLKKVSESSLQCYSSNPSDSEAIDFEQAHIMDERAKVHAIQDGRRHNAEKNENPDKEIKVLQKPPSHINQSRSCKNMKYQLK